MRSAPPALGGVVAADEPGGLQRKTGAVEMDIVSVLSVLIAILSIVVVGAIGFWAVERFVTDRRLANLLKLLVVLVCLGAIVHRLPALTY
jgi:hypothetical protein